MHRGKILRGLRILLHDSERKPLPAIIRDVGGCAWREREVPYYYFTHLLYKQSAGNVTAHVGFKRLAAIRRLIAPTGAREHIKDKLVFRERLTAHGLPQPVLRAHTEDRVMTCDGQEIHLGSSEDLARVARRLAAASPTGSVFFKPVAGGQGSGCHRVDADARAGVENVWAALQGSRYVIEESLAQHPAVSAIYPHAVNTVRVHTYREGAKTEVLSALLRVGRGGSVVDNISAGGIYVPVDVETGRLGRVGRVFFWNGANTFLEHPDTHFRFGDFTVPMFAEVLELTNRAALAFEDGFLGWDIAITPEGPVIVEANSRFHIVMAQVAAGGFRSHAGFSRVFARSL